MLCYVYKSLKKEQSYLYITKRGDFSRVPEQLLLMFGERQLVMSLNLDENSKLAMVDAGHLKEQLIHQGFYLQLPPSQENQLEAYRALKGKNSSSK
ncbi:MAG: Protein YcgL [Candidatus Celerinatantimonas neptuna]|nr:MAG: Protein YcgL [Candidatus Celerinatantimonas neptuna]